MTDRAPLPDVCRVWPQPRGTKTAPMRWYSTHAEYRALFEQALTHGGEDALAVIWHSSRRSPGSGLTRWFAPGVPMHTTGAHYTSSRGTVWHGYFVPARLALDAADEGHITFLDRPAPE